MKKLYARHFQSVTMKVDAGLRFELSARQALGQTTIKGSKRWRDNRTPYVPKERWLLTGG